MNWVARWRAGRHGDIFDQEDGLGVGFAEWFEESDGADKIEVGLIESDFLIDADTGEEILWSEALGRILVDRGCEGIDVFDGETHSGGSGVPAAFDEEVAVGFDGFKEVERGD